MPYEMGVSQRRREGGARAAGPGFGDDKQPEDDGVGGERALAGVGDPPGRASCPVCGGPGLRRGMES